MSRPLYLLPGLGADQRLFAPQVRRLEDVHVLGWVEPDHFEESLPSYARRLVSFINVGHPFDIGGSSFGGMVALELARHLRPENVILIGSCRSATELPSYYKLLQRMSKLLPDQLLRPPAMLSSLIAHQFGIRRDDHRKLFFNMLHETPGRFIRWATDNVFKWTGSDDLEIPVHHIHGSDDHIIPLRKIRADRVVEGAGHLLNLTHADEVNDFIEGVRSKGSKPS